MLGGVYSPWLNQLFTNAGCGKRQPLCKNVVGLIVKNFFHFITEVDHGYELAVVLTTQS